MGAFTRQGAHGKIVTRSAQQRLQLHHLLRKAFGAGILYAQCLHHGGVPSRCPAKAEIDPAGIERGKRAKGLGHCEGCVVGQHDPARTDPDGRGQARDMSDQDRGCGRGNARHVVVFGKPVTMKAQGFGMTREIAGIAQGSGGIQTFGYRGEIEKRIAHATPPWLDSTNWMGRCQGGAGLTPRHLKQMS